MTDRRRGRVRSALARGERQDRDQEGQRWGVALVRLDPVDERIVALLLDDGRASFAEIGARVGLSAPAVKRRVDRLRRSGVITGKRSAVLWHVLRPR